MQLEAIAISPKTPDATKGVVVMLHGWGANAKDLTSLVPSLNLPDYKFFSVEAPFPHPQVPNGKMWYNLEVEDRQGLATSQRALTDWLQALPETTNIPFSRTCLLGFSQGGAMALDIGIRFPLAGIVSLSGYLHEQPQPQTDRIPPVFMAHGTNDPVVPINMSYQARETLESLGSSIDYQEFAMGHEIALPVLESVKNFIERSVGPALGS